MERVRSLSIELTLSCIIREYKDWRDFVHSYGRNVNPAKGVFSLNVLYPVQINCRGECLANWMKWACFGLWALNSADAKLLYLCVVTDFQSVWILYPTLIVMLQRLKSYLFLQRNETFRILRYYLGAGSPRGRTTRRLPLQPVVLQANTIS